MASWRTPGSRHNFENRVCVVTHRRWPQHLFSISCGIIWQTSHSHQGGDVVLPKGPGWGFQASVPWSIVSLSRSSSISNTPWMWFMLLGPLRKLWYIILNHWRIQCLDEFLDGHQTSDKESTQKNDRQHKIPYISVNDQLDFFFFLFICLFGGGGWQHASRSHCGGTWPKIIFWQLRITTWRSKYKSRLFCAL